MSQLGQRWMGPSCLVQIIRSPASWLGAAGYCCASYGCAATVSAGATWCATGGTTVVG